MQALRNQLAALDPPIKHELESQGDNLVITLIDPARPARVTRTLSQSLVRNTPLLYEVIRDAVNQLRALGSRPAITDQDIYPDDRPRPPDHSDHGSAKTGWGRSGGGVIPPGRGRALG